LKEILSENAIKVTELEVYQKVLTPIKIEQTIDAVLFFSPSQIDSFKMQNDLPIDTPAFCIGNTTADYLKSKKHINCMVAKNQSVKSVIETAITYFLKHE
jgi:uroporphyrinogen-III synthase